MCACYSMCVEVRGKLITENSSLLQPRGRVLLLLLLCCFVSKRRAGLRASRQFSHLAIGMLGLQICTTSPPHPAFFLSFFFFCFFLYFFFFFFFFFGFFRDRVSLCSSGCPGAHFVDQAGLRNPPASASRVLGLKACATTPRTSGFLCGF